MGRNTKIIEERATISGTAELITTQYFYDAKGELTKTISPDGATSLTEYNAIGKPTKLVDPQGRVIRMEYDNRGALSKQLYADDTFETYQYDADGLMIAATDRLGRTTQNVYDGADRLVSTIYPDATSDPADNPKVVYLYDAAGQLIKETDAAGSVYEYKYDLVGRTIETIDPYGNSTKMIYDDIGQRTSSVDAAGQVTRYEYDGARRLIKLTMPDGTAPETDNPTRLFSYDGQGNKTSETDELGRVARFAYNSLGQLLRVVKPNPATGANPALVDNESPPNSGTLVTKYGYDAQGNIVSVIDGNGNETKVAYDEVNRPISKILPLGQRMTMEYFGDGRLKAMTNYRGQRATYDYDLVNGWLNKVNHADGRVSEFRYQSNGQKIEEKHMLGAQVISSMAYKYDERGRMIASRQADVPLIPDTQDTIQYQYDTNGNMVRMKSAAQIVNYGYEPSGRYTIEEGGQTTRYTFDARGNTALVEMSDNSTIAMSYDERSRLKTMVHKNAANAVLLSQVYTLNALGLRTGIQENYGVAPSAVQRTHTYQYDHVARLTNASVVGASPYSETFIYDRASNRTQYSRNTFGNVNASYDANNRIVSETGSRARTFEFDSDGNLTKIKQGSNVLSTLTWDSTNQLIEVLKSGNTTRYRYGVDGIRAGKETLAGTPNSVEVFDHIDRTKNYAQVMERYKNNAGTPSLMSRRLHGPTRPLEEVRCGPGSTTTCLSPQRSILHGDGQGSIRLLTDTAGAVQGRAAFTAFGELDSAQTTGARPSYGYTGEEFDAEADAYYLRARYMDPSQGRMLSTDPLPGRATDPLSMHPYTYAHLDPANNSDPTGQFTLGELSSAINTVGNLYNTAMPIIQLISPDTAEAIESEIPSLFDYLLPLVIGAAGTQVSADSVDGAGGSGANRSALFPIPLVEKHHTIPVYLCGRLKGQHLVPMGKSLHVIIHRNMSLFEDSVNIGGKALELIFKRSRRSSYSRRMIVKAARTKPGRSAISGGIGSIYAGMGVLDYQREATDIPLGVVFAAESIAFIASPKNTSYSANCSRTK